MSAMSDSDDELVLTPRQSLFDNLVMSDITIDCGELSVFAHKAILSLHSAYFERLFKAELYKEKMSELDLTDSGGDAMNMLRHIYGLELEYEYRGYTAVPGEAVCVDMSILDAGHIYEVPSLIKFMEARIIDRLDAAIDRAEVAKQVGAIYHWSQGKYCKFVAKECLKDFEGLMANPDFRNVCSEEPQLAVGLLEESMDASLKMAVELVKKTMKIKPMLAPSLMKEAMDQRSTLAPNLLSDVLVLRKKAANKKRKRRTTS